MKDFADFLFTPMGLAIVNFIFIMAPAYLNIMIKYDGKPHWWNHPLLLGFMTIAYLAWFVFAVVLQPMLIIGGVIFLAVVLLSVSMNSVVYNLTYMFKKSDPPMTWLHFQFSDVLCYAAVISVASGCLVSLGKLFLPPY